MSKNRLIIAIVVAAVVAAAFVVLKTGMFGSSTQKYSFESMDGFLSATRGGSGDAHQVVMIGLDGASWTIIDSMIADGKLPTIERLKREGASGPLRSVDCYFTPPAWTSMLTGFLPHHTGIYTFGKWNTGKRRFDAVSVLDVEVPFVWDVASAAGRRVAVTNVPMTYPTYSVNGIMVGGLMSPIVYDNWKDPRTVSFRKWSGTAGVPNDRRTFSPPLVAKAAAHSAPILFVLYDTTNDQIENYDTVAMRVYRPGVVDFSLNAEPSLYPLGEYSPWVEFECRKERRGETESVLGCVKVELAAPVLSRPGRKGTLKFAPFHRLPTDPKLALTYPEPLAADIEKRFGKYIVSLGSHADLVADQMGTLTGNADYFYDYDDWDLFLYVFQAPDNVQHRVGFREETEQVYQRLDEFLARLIERLREDATLVITSDHGFADYDYIIDFNYFLETIGLIPNANRVNFKTALAFADQWCLYFNDKLLTAEELARAGIDIPAGATPRETLINYIKERAAQITHPETGQPMPVELIDIPQDGQGVPPDMVITGTYSNYLVEANDIEMKSREVVRDAPAYPYHHPDGVYLFWGPRIEAGASPGVVNIENIAPTMLYLMGLPLDPSMDGSVISEIIKPEFADNRPYTIDDYNRLRPSITYSEEDREGLEEMLRSIGYIQ